MDDLFAVFVSRLDQAGIESMIVGSVAAMAYGEPRLTNDIDLVVTLEIAQIPALLAAFPDELFDCAPAEVVRVEVLRGHRGHFNIIHHETGFKADVYVAGRDPLHRWAMQRRRRLRLGSQALSVAPPEYVIVRKLEFYREGGSQKHVHDIRRMLETSGEQIDTEQLQSMIAQRGLDEVWAAVLAATD